MADDPTTQTPEQLQAIAAAAQDASNNLKLVQESSDGAASSLDNMGSITDGVKEIFGGLTARMEAFGTSLNVVGSLTDQQTAQFGLLSAATLGARDSFAKYGEGISTFKGQFQELSDNISRSPAFGSAAARVAELSKQLLGMGAPTEGVKKAAEGGFGALVKFGQAFLTSADNGLKLQNAYIQMASATGNLGKVYGKAGEDLGDMNSILAVQNKIMSESVTATGLSEKQVEDYYMALGHVPEALESTITTLDGTDKKMSMLTASIKLAHGTGRDFTKIVADIEKAFKDYGMTGESALTFTERFSELSQKFKVPLEDVRNGLMSAAGGFQAITDAGEASGKMTESLSGIMNDYIGTLKEVGSTGPHAIDMVKNFTTQVGHLSVAQKGFLSAQSGGPGGLMGAFQIEKDIREGKIDKVFDQVRNTMQKQFGKIVTLEEASQSQQAASQLQKQMMLLQKGPLGGLVKSDQDAYRMLEGFRAKQEGRAAPDMGAAGLNQQGLQNAINRGTSFEEKSYTQLTVMNSHLAAIRKASEVPNLGLVQKAGTASTGDRGMFGPGGIDTDAQTKMRGGLKGAQQQATYRGGQVAGDFKDQMAGPGGVINQTGKFAAESVNDLMGWFKQLPATLGSMRDTLKQAVLSGDTKKMDSEVQKITKDIEQKRASLANMNAADKQKMLAQIKQEEDTVKGFQNWREKYGSGVTGATPGVRAQGGTARPGNLGPLPRNVATPGQGVAAAPRGTATQTGGGAQGGPGRAGGNTGAPTPDVQVTEQGTGGRIKVNVTVNVKDDGGVGNSVTPARM